jgi:hypothetical protein
MKTKNKKHVKPLHLHLDHFFRRQYVIYGILALVAVGLCKADNRLLTVMHQAYTEGFQDVGEHMREETTRMPVLVNIARVTTVSGR